jgi:hypothetical protein
MTVTAQLTIVIDSGSLTVKNDEPLVVPQTQAAKSRLGRSLAPLRRLQRSMSRANVSDAHSLEMVIIEDGSSSDLSSPLSTTSSQTEPTILILAFELNGTKQFSSTKDMARYLELVILPRVDGALPLVEQRTKRIPRTKSLRTTRRQLSGVKIGATPDSLNKLARGTYRVLEE